MKSSVCLALLLVVVVTPLITFAQLETLKGTGGSLLMEKEYVSVDGSPYLLKGWADGIILDKTGKANAGLQLRYDTYRDEVQMLQSDRAFVIDPKLVQEFFIVNQRFKNGLNVDGFSTLDYFEIIYNSPQISFVKKHKTDYLEEVVNNYGTNEKVKRFVTTKHEFIILDSKTFELNRKRSNLFEVFGGSKDEMQKYQRSERLDIRKDSDLVSLLQYYTSTFK